MRWLDAIGAWLAGPAQPAPAAAPDLIEERGAPRVETVAQSAATSLPGGAGMPVDRSAPTSGSVAQATAQPSVASPVPPSAPASAPAPAGGIGGGRSGGSALERAAALIAPFEGFRAKPYLCPAGVWTIGYGTTRYPDGKAVERGDYPVTEPQARALLAGDLKERDAAILRMVAGRVMTDGQHVAFLSFAHNLGLGALSGSTLLRKFLAGDVKGAAAEFPKWNKGGGRVLDGLVKRREAERRLFLS